jgi:hypothetical protein
VVSENRKTGNNKHTWKFFKELHDIYFKNPKYHPQFTVSSTPPYNQTTQKNNAESPHCSIKNIGSTDDGVFNDKPDKESCTKNLCPRKRKTTTLSEIEHINKNATKKKWSKKKLCSSGCSKISEKENEMFIV